MQTQSPEFKMRSNSPLVANGYPLSGGNLIEIQKKHKNEVLTQVKNGLRGSATQLTFRIKYRYCISGSDCERPVTG